MTMKLSMKIKHTSANSHTLPGKLFGRHNPKCLQDGVVDSVVQHERLWISLWCPVLYLALHYQPFHQQFSYGIGSILEWRAMIQARHGNFNNQHQWKDQ